MSERTQERASKTKHRQNDAVAFCAKITNLSLSPYIYAHAARQWHEGERKTKPQQASINSLINQRGLLETQRKQKNQENKPLVDAFFLKFWSPVSICSPIALGSFPPKMGVLFVSFFFVQPRQQQRQYGHHSTRRRLRGQHDDEPITLLLETGGVVAAAAAVVEAPFAGRRVGNSGISSSASGRRRRRRSSSSTGDDEEDEGSGNSSRSR